MLTDQEANEYLDALLSGKCRPQEQDGLIVNRLTSSNTEILKLERITRQLSSDLEQARTAHLKELGRREGYAQILVDAEDKRRSRKETKKESTVPGGKAPELTKEQIADLSEKLGVEMEHPRLVAVGEKGE